MPSFLPVVLGAGALSIAHTVHVGEAASYSSGEEVKGGRIVSFSQNGYFFWLRGGAIDTDRYTHLGHQAGVEYAATLGVESPLYGFSGSFLLGIPIRVATWTNPGLGALTVHVDTELGLGNVWWADSARLLAMLGLRGNWEAWKFAEVELDYTWVPLVVAKSPIPLDLLRQEHRGTVSIGLGPVGIGGRAVFSRESVTMPDTSVHTASWTWLAFLEGRL